MDLKKIDILLFCRYIAVFVYSFSITWEYGTPVNPQWGGGVSVRVHFSHIFVTFK